MSDATLSTPADGHACEGMFPPVTVFYAPQYAKWCVYLGEQAGQTLVGIHNCPFCGIGLGVVDGQPVTELDEHGRYMASLHREMSRLRAQHIHETLKIARQARDLGESRRGIVLTEERPPDPATPADLPRLGERWLKRLGTSTIRELAAAELNSDGEVSVYLGLFKIRYGLYIEEARQLSAALSWAYELALEMEQVAKEAHD